MPDFLPKLDLKKDQQKVTPTDVINMKRLEEVNLQRAIKYKKLRRRNVFTGLSLFAGVVAIYVYTINSVKQEKFLDDFNEPEKITLE